jgi:aminopeptidase
LTLTDPRIINLAKILVDHSIRVQPDDRVLIEATTAAESLVAALYVLILKRGGYPHLDLTFKDQDELFFAHAGEAQLDFIPTFRKLAYDTFEARVRINSSTNPQALKDVDPARLSRYQKTTAPILHAQMSRGAAGEFKWVSTLYPTPGLAAEAGMSIEEYRDFVFHACHADATSPDPLETWGAVEHDQQRIIDLFEGHDQVILRGPHVDLSLSIKGRTFMNAFGRNNMPDGEVYTGPVENSLNGWVHYTYPSIYQGQIVEDIQLKFEQGKVVQASARHNQDFLLRNLDADAGARYVGEFAIGTNFGITRATHNTLFDEKIGGSFHMALGAGYPETGSLNKSVIHWDMVCDLKTDSVILVDGEVIFRDGKFVN